MSYQEVKEKILQSAGVQGQIIYAAPHFISAATYANDDADKLTRQADVLIDVAQMIQSRVKSNEEIPLSTILLLMQDDFTGLVTGFKPHELVKLEGGPEAFSSAIENIDGHLVRRHDTSHRNMFFN